MAKPEPHHLTRQIVIAMLAGIMLGVILNQLGAASWIQLFVIDGVLQVVGSVFVAALKLMVVPLVFVSLVVGVTASSGATIPVTLHTVEHKTGVKNSIAAFTVPMGASINMDGTAMMQGVISCIVAKIEHALDQSVFNDPDAGSIESATRHSIPTPPTP